MEKLIRGMTVAVPVQGALQQSPPLERPADRL